MKVKKKKKKIVKLFNNQKPYDEVCQLLREITLKMHCFASIKYPTNVTNCKYGVFDGRKFLSFELSIKGVSTQFQLPAGKLRETQTLNSHFPLQ